MKRKPVVFVVLFFVILGLFAGMTFSTAPGVGTGITVTEADCFAAKRSSSANTASLREAE